MEHVSYRVFFSVPFGVSFYGVSPFFVIFSFWYPLGFIQFDSVPPFFFFTRVRRAAHATGSSCFPWSNGSTLDRVSLMLIEPPFAFSLSEGCFGPVRALFSGRFNFCYRYRLDSFSSDENFAANTSRSCGECPEASGIIYTAEFNNSAAELGLGFGRLDVLNSPEGPKGPWVHWPTPGPRGYPRAQYKGPFHDMPISECRKSAERN